MSKSHLLEPLEHEAMRAFVDRIASASDFLSLKPGLIMHLLRDNEGWSALDVAVADGNMLAFDRLCALGADPFMNDFHGLSLLFVASANAKPDMVQCLLGLGFLVNSVDENGMTPLMFASRNGSPDCLALLLCAGADLDLVNHDGLDARAHAKIPAICALLDQARASREALSLDDHLPTARPSLRSTGL